MFPYPAQPVPPRAKPKSSSNVVVIGMVLAGLGVLALVVLVGGYFGYRHFFGGMRKSVLVSKELEATVSQDQVLDYQGKLKVTVPKGILKSKTRLTLSSVSGAPLTDGITSVRSAYDVALGNLHQFDDFIQVELPIDPSVAAKTRRVLVTWDETSRRWEPVVYRPTPGRPTLTVFTRHLSTFADAEPGGGKLSPTMQLPPGRSTGAGGQTDKLSQAVSKLSRGEPLGESAFELGFESFNENFALTAAGFTFGEEALEMTGLKSINEGFTKLGYGLAAFQLYMDLMSEKRDSDRTKTVLNAMKNVGMIAIGEGWSALKIAGCAVTIIDISLSRFANAAIRGRREEWNRTYRAYYAADLPRSDGQWYQILKGIVDRNKDPDALRAAIQKEVDDYTKQGWIEDGRLAPHFPGGFSFDAGISEALQQDISNGFKNDLFQGPVGKALADIQKRMVAQIAEENDATQKKIAAEFNLVRTLDVSVESPDPKQNLGGLAFEVPVAKNPAAWQGKTDKDGKFKMQFTLAGFLAYGAKGPAKLKVPMPGSPEPKVFTAPIRIAGQVVKVVFKLNPTAGEFAGKMGGTAKVPGYDGPVVFDGPANVTIDPSNQVSMNFTATSSPTAGKGMAKLSLSVTGKLNGTLDGKKVSMKGSGSAKYDLTFNVKLPGGAPKGLFGPRSGSSNPSFAAEGTLSDDGTRIQGTVRDADAKTSTTLTFDVKATGGQK
jgi:hypothetical protein